LTIWKSVRQLALLGTDHIVITEQLGDLIHAGENVSEITALLRTGLRVNCVTPSLLSGRLVRPPGRRLPNFGKRPFPIVQASYRSLVPLFEGGLSEPFRFLACRPFAESAGAIFAFEDVGILFDLLTRSC
jgi:hypothetical protein